MVPHDEAQGQYFPKEVHDVVNRWHMLYCTGLEEEDSGSGEVGQSEDNEDHLNLSALVFQLLREVLVDVPGEEDVGDAKAHRDK